MSRKQIEANYVASDLIRSAEVFESLGHYRHARDEALRAVLEAGTSKMREKAQALADRLSVKLADQSAPSKPRRKHEYW